METEDTFDGSGQVAKHVDHVRHDDSQGDLNGTNIVYAMSDTTTSTHLLHSTVLGGKRLSMNGRMLIGLMTWT